MSLVTSLLTAIVRADGDALVLHAGERPYVVAPTGQSELASRALTLDAMRGMIEELLPADAQHTLVDIGAVQQELAPPSFAKAERFTVIAARGGDDIWIEIRRHRAPKVPKVVVAAVPVIAAMPAPAPPVAPAEVAPPQVIVTPIEVVAPAEATMPADVAVPDHQEPAQSEPAFELTSEIDTTSIEEVAEEEPETRREPQPELALEAQAEAEPEVETDTEHRDRDGHRDRDVEHRAHQRGFRDRHRSSRGRGREPGCESGRSAAGQWNRNRTARTGTGTARRTGT